jgi:hypothetical protein
MRTYRKHSGPQVDTNDKPPGPNPQSLAMRARVGDIPAAQDATWRAVFATLYAAHCNDWHFDWTGHRQDQPDAYSVMQIRAPGEEVDAMRAEIEEVIGFVNEIADRDPLNRMVAVDTGLVEVLVD